MVFLGGWLLSAIGGAYTLLNLVTLGVAGRERSRLFYEEGLSWRRGNDHTEVVFFQTAKPDWSEVGERAWRDVQRNVSRSDGGGASVK